MSTFALIPIESINTRDDFFELIIDDVNCFDNFIRGLEVKDKKNVISIYKYMELVGNRTVLSKEKFRFIEGSKAAYEFKKNNIRLYCFKYEDLYWIMAHGGYKKTQNRDISIIQDLEAQCLERGFSNGIQ